MNRHIAISVALGLMAIGQISVAQHENGAAPATRPGGFHLGTRLNGATGKASFLLNGQPFYPFVYYENFRAVTPQLLTRLRSDGFNSIQLAIDTSDADSADLKRILELLHRQGLPAIVEINEGEFWKALRADLSLNMVTLDGKPIKHFPDYANPETRRLHLEKFARAARLLQPYAHQPVIGICVGAYDAYHIPDGESHPEFEAPKLVRKYQTLLPFGEHARNRFIQYLKDSGAAPQALGLERLENMAHPPATPEEAATPLLWQLWIHFRRHLVREWLKDTLDVVKAATGLPVTVTFDINFSLREQYATPPAGWVDLLDFVILYYYGKGNPDEYIPKLLREVYRGFNAAAKPMICLHEFSSAYGGTSGEAYARNAAPFVAGMMTTGPGQTPFSAHPHNQERVQSFTRWVREQLGTLATLAPPLSPVLVVLDQDRPYVENPFAATLASLGIGYDVIYLAAASPMPSMNGYSKLLVPPDFANQLKGKLPSGKMVITDPMGINP